MTLRRRLDRVAAVLDGVPAVESSGEAPPEVVRLGRALPDEPLDNVDPDECERRLQIAFAIGDAYRSWRGRDVRQPKMPPVVAAERERLEERFRAARADRARACVARGADPASWRVLYGDVVDEWVKQAQASDVDRPAKLEDTLLPGATTPVDEDERQRLIREWEDHQRQEEEERLWQQHRRMRDAIGTPSRDVLDLI